jgi:hypothetical protein
MDSPELMKTLSAGALRTYSEKFTGQIFAESVERTYRTALKGATDGQTTA